MDFSQLIKVRQSTRSYSEKPVERDKLIKCLEAARLSPSACNSQPWKFIIADDKDLVKQIAGCTYGKVVRFNKFTDSAKAFAVIVMEPGNLRSSAGSIKTSTDYANIDMGIAVSGFCYQAADLGLGTCIIGWYREKDIKRILKIPGNKKIGLLISIGYPKDNTVREKSRKPLDNMSSFNGF